MHCSLCYTCLVVWSSGLEYSIILLRRDITELCGAELSAGSQTETEKPSSVGHWESSKSADPRQDWLVTTRRVVSQHFTNNFTETGGNLAQLAPQSQSVSRGCHSNQVTSSQQSSCHRHHLGSTGGRTSPVSSTHTTWNRRRRGRWRRKGRRSTSVFWEKPRENLVSLSLASSLPCLCMAIPRSWPQSVREKCPWMTFSGTGAPGSTCLLHQSGDYRLNTAPAAVSVRAGSQAKTIQERTVETVETRDISPSSSPTLSPSSSGRAWESCSTREMSSNNQIFLYEPLSVQTSYDNHSILAADIFIVYVCIYSRE